MGSLTATTKPKRLLLSAFALVVLVSAMFASTASAGLFPIEYSGHNLPGHTWTTGNGIVLPKEDFIEGWANTTSSVCVGPVTHDGSGFHMPYGWSCATEKRLWVFSPITAAAGLYNPNSGTFGSYWAIAGGE